MKSLSGRRPRVKLSNNELLRRVRLGETRRLLRDRCGSVLPDDDAGREYLKELLLQISLGPYEAIRRPGATQLWGPTDRMRREIELWAPWMSEDEALELRLEVNAMPEWERKPMARTLGERLQLTYADRSRLRIRTIGPCDMTEAIMAVIRKQKRRQREKARRLSRGAKSQAASITRTRPWIAAGFNTRRTWERHGKPDVATSCPINLTTTEHILATKEEHSANADTALCGRLPPPTHAVPTPTNDNWTYASLADWAWQQDVHSLAG